METLKAILRGVWGKLISVWPPNRIVTVLGPLIFVPLAGYLAVKAAEWGLPPLDPGFLAGIFAAGALAAIEALRKFMEGWIAYEAQLADPAKDPVLAGVHKTPPPDIKESGTPVAGEYDVTYDDGEGLDDEALLSQPDDIAESDIDDADVAERRQRVPDAE
jgi:hypothetical protein